MWKTGGNDTIKLGVVALTPIMRMKPYIFVFWMVMSDHNSLLYDSEDRILPRGLHGGNAPAHERIDVLRLQQCERQRRILLSRADQEIERRFHLGNLASMEYWISGVTI